MKPGDVIADRFELVRVAGEGGMGLVFQARELVSGRLCAIKLLLRTSAQARRRFEREAQILASLVHPNIVRYLDHGVTAASGPYLAMEWLEGEELPTHLAGGELGVRAGVTLGRRVAEALGVAHARGVVHRDVKPRNLFLVARSVEQVKVLDFGVAHVATTSGAMTRSGVFVGTAGYMAPEQAGSSRAVTARADIFSLGCVLFECLTGRPPFSGDRMMAVMAKILFEEAPRPSEIRGDLPPELDELIVRMMAKDPDDRPESAAAVAAELALIEQEQGPAGSPGNLRRPSLTAGEQRLFSVIVSGEGPAQNAEASTRSLGPDEESTPPRDDRVDRADARLRAELLPFEAELEVLADGSIVATLSGRGNAADQAARAARCALAIHRALSAPPIVLATGRGVLERRSLVGDVIDRAVRMLSARGLGAGGAGAERSGVALDEVTAGLLGRRFEVIAGASGLELRGERGPAEEDLATRLGRPTPCVGREGELSLLTTLFEESAEEPMARVVLVTGDAGIGKSRLRHEFVRRARRAQPEATVWAARGDPIRKGAPLGMLADLLRSAAAPPDDDPLAPSSDDIRADMAVPADGMTTTTTTAAHATTLLALLEGDAASRPSAEPPTSRQSASPAAPLAPARMEAPPVSDELRRAWESLVAGACATRPLLLVLEDLHWGDLPTVQLVDAALRALRDRPILVLAIARPEVDEIFPRLWADRNLQEIRLGALSRRASERLAREALGGATPATLVERVASQAAGNALYLEELIRDVALGRGDALPETVLAMEQARIEALGPQARRVLRAGSVFGQVFVRAGVEALLGDAGIAEVLEALRASEILRSSPGASLGGLGGEESERERGEAAYAFGHVALREAAYAMLTPSDRALGHRLAAAWLEREGEGDLMALAAHLERGEEHARASALYHGAAEQALDAGDVAAALDRAARAVASGAEAEALGALRRIEAEAHLRRGDIEAAARRGEEAMRLLPRDDPRWWLAAEVKARAAWAQTDEPAFLAAVEAMRSPPAEQARAARERAIACLSRLLAEVGLEATSRQLLDALRDR
jgi:eukaryotic-like serine/threonine-protein kinase